MSTVERPRDLDPASAGRRPAARPAHVPRTLRGDAAGDEGGARGRSCLYAFADEGRSRQDQSRRGLLVVPLSAPYPGSGRSRRRDGQARSAWGAPARLGPLRFPPSWAARADVDAEGYLVGAPELVVEIARSSRAYDLGAKKADYERAGVREYVVVELDPDRIHWFIRRDDRFEELPPGPDGIFRSEVFPGLWLDPEALYRRRPGSD